MGSRGTNQGNVAALVLGAVGVLAAAGPAGAQPLRRDLSSYFVLAQKSASLKNLDLGSACNVGVNCGSPDPNASCGSLSLDDVLFADGSQTVSDKAFFHKPGAKIFQLFRNDNSSLANVTVNAPPPMPFATPIIPGTCGAGCAPDVVALEAVCGFPNPFPACDPTKPVTAKAGKDCSAGDTTPANGQCDLAPGVYGDVSVQNLATLVLAPGNYTFCTFKVGRNADVQSKNVTVNIPDKGAFRISNESKVGRKCGDLTVLLQGKGGVAFGRSDFIAARVCAPESRMALGHGNTLIGQFVGDVIAADRNNHGMCCGGKCTCFDTFSPTSGKVNDVITLSSQCDLTNANGARICNIAATVVSKTVAELKIKIPVGALGQCLVEVDSAAGQFVSAGKLNVLP